MRRWWNRTDPVEKEMHRLKEANEWLMRKSKERRSESLDLESLLYAAVQAAGGRIEVPEEAYEFSKYKRVQCVKNLSKKVFVLCVCVEDMPKKA